MKLIHTENVGGRIERWWKHFGDDGREKITIQTVQDVEPILERNKRAYNEAPRRFGNEPFQKIADIPVTIVEEECRRIVANTGEKMRNVFREIAMCKTDRAKSVWRKLLNSPEFKYFRTRPGRVK